MLINLGLSLHVLWPNILTEFFDGYARNSSPDRMLGVPPGFLGSIDAELEPLKIAARDRRAKTVASRLGRTTRNWAGGARKAERQKFDSRTHRRDPCPAL